MASWISNLSGSLSVSGRDIEVKEFNLPAIIRAVAYVRTVADILNVVKRAFPSGNTVFPRLDGQWAINKGVVETANAKIYSSQADGLILSSFDLLNWTTKNSFIFDLKSLNVTPSPNIIVNIYGDGNSPKVDFDTRSLEQYVNSKTSEKLLKEYGN
jgi:hypothetical protein